MFDFKAVSAGGEKAGEDIELSCFEIPGWSWI